MNSKGEEGEAHLKKGLRFPPAAGENKEHSVTAKQNRKPKCSNMTMIELNNRNLLLWSY